jgi:hypothetical protein
MEPVLCPVCTLRTIEPILDGASITARVQHDNIGHEVKAYRCTEYNHIFFLRKADIRGVPEMASYDAKAARVEETKASPCPLCRGTGVDNGDMCKTCGGRGELLLPAHALMRCPLCTRAELERLLERVTITAKIDRENTAGGILAYRCTENGHIFFVRVADVETPLMPGLALNL